MLKSGVKNRGKNALALCSFFGISVEVQRPDKQEISDINQVLAEILDGTQDQAALIAALLRSAKGFKVTRAGGSSDNQARSGRIMGDD